ncbi:hypothetical protein C8R43DRAFT_1242746 [Mycena crocata]|nr:hypothetical protein C8R43DRAFT_1242746 [Mycena crocata]
MPDPLEWPWKVYCISGTVKDTITAEMVDAYRRNLPYEARYTYYPPTLPAKYAARRCAFGEVFYGILGIEHDDLPRRDAENIRNYEFFDAPVGLIFTISSELR